MAELTGDMTIKSSYVYAGPQLLKEEPSTTDRSRDLYMLHEGEVGSVTHTVDMNGSIRNEYDYDTFGTRSHVRTASTGSNQHFGYTGEMIDEESGLLYLRARYYDPSIGRFISADPYLGRMAEPVTQNRYIYVHNNPLLFVDPEGLASLSVSCGIGPSSLGFKMNPDTGEFFFVNSNVMTGIDAGCSFGFNFFDQPKEGINIIAFGEATGGAKLGLGASGSYELSPGDDSGELDVSIGAGFKFSGGLKEETTIPLFTFSNNAISDFLEGCY